MAKEETVDEHEAALADALVEATKTCPPGARAYETTYDLDRELRFAFITEIEPELVPPDRGSTVLRTEGSCASTCWPPDMDFVRRSIGKLAERHREEWEFVHSPAYAEALAKTRANA